MSLWVGGRSRFHNVTHFSLILQGTFLYQQVREKCMYLLFDVAHFKYTLLHYKKVYECYIDCLPI